MPRKKLIRIKRAKNLPNIIDSPKIYTGFWKRAFFGNENPIILELACGKGEYAIGLAKIFPEKNLIGIDRKLDRLWHGASQAIENNLKEGVLYYFEKPVDLNLLNCTIKHLLEIKDLEQNLKI